jgi:MFS transporter, ACS family, hexuronate transporter
MTTDSRKIAVRWSIAFMVCAAIAISYFDRQTLPVAIRAIQQDIPLTNEQFSWLNSAFLIAYALMYMGGGKLIDVLGTRRGYFLIMGGWSLACASHSLATGLVMLGGSRILLGLGEGGGFPAATKAVAEWFPVSERSKAMGIINAGTAVGAVVAPPAIALIIETAGWRWVFVAAGAVGLLWTVWWLKSYFPPASHPRLGSSERALLGEVMAGEEEAGPGIPWLKLFRFPQVWGLVVAKFLGDAAWYFYLFWLPKYLYDARGFDTKQVGAYAWIPYAAAGIGCLAGGWFSSSLIKRGRTLNAARKVALGASVAVMPLIFFVTQVPVSMALVLFSLAFCGQQSWSTLIMILPADIFPRNTVGSVAGLVGFGGAMGGVVFGLVVGWMLDHGFGYGPVFGIVSTFHVVAFLIILLTIKVVKPVAVPVQEAR